MNSAYSHCPRCGGAAWTGGFCHVPGCRWPDPERLESYHASYGGTNDSRLDTIISLLREVLAALRKDEP